MTEEKKEQESQKQQKEEQAKEVPSTDKPQEKPPKEEERKGSEGTKEASEAVLSIKDLFHLIGTMIFTNIRMRTDLSLNILSQYK